MQHLLAQVYALVNTCCFRRKSRSRELFLTQTGAAAGRSKVRPQALVGGQRDEDLFYFVLPQVCTCLLFTEIFQNAPRYAEVLRFIKPNYMVTRCTGGGEQKAPTSTQLPPFHNSAVVPAAYKPVGYFGTRRPFYLSRPHSGSSCTFSKPHHNKSK